MVDQSYLRWSVDALPTLLHLLGVDTKNYIQLGQDLFSKNHDKLLFSEMAIFVTPKYTFYGGTIYDNNTGEAITEPSQEVQNEIDALKEKVKLNNWLF